MECNSADSYELVFVLDDFHLHKNGSHSSQGLMCSGLVS